MMRDDAAMSEIDTRLWALAHASPFGERPDLGRMRRLLAHLGDPQIGLPVLHVGGTAGKGSTATIAAALLTAAGYRTGLHTKPHLRRVNERIVVNGAPISDSDLLALIEEAAPRRHVRRHKCCAAACRRADECRIGPHGNPRRHRGGDRAG